MATLHALLAQVENGYGQVVGNRGCHEASSTLWGVQGVEIQGFTVQNSAADGMNGRQGAAFTVRDVRVFHSADDGIEATETSTVRFLGICKCAAVVKMALRSPMAPVRCSALSASQRTRMPVGGSLSLGRRQPHSTWSGAHDPEHLRDPHPGALQSDAGPHHADYALRRITCLTAYWSPTRPTFGSMGDDHRRQEWACRAIVRVRAASAILGGIILSEYNTEEQEQDSSRIAQLIA